MKKKSWQQRQKDAIKALEKTISVLIEHPDSEDARMIRNRYYISKGQKEQFKPMIQIYRQLGKLPLTPTDATTYP